jgi:hypothetical protein
MSEGTPRLWKRGKDADAQYIVAEGGECPDKRIAQLYYGGTTREERNANANLIVRAVNAYDDLVEACELAQQYIEWELGEYLGHHPLALKAQDKLKTALAKAKARP